MDKATILVIDDESQIRKLLEITLHSNDYHVALASSAKDGMMIAASHPPDMIILDLGLPDTNGHLVLQQLREWYTSPIMILSVQSSEEDIIKALDNGANDYLVKPFRTGELLARIRSSLRNTLNDAEPILLFGDLEINLPERTVKKNGETVKLTGTEYSLLAHFVRHEGKVLTHQYLLREIWGPGYINQSQYLRVFIAQLRKKIETDPNRPLFIRTESGIGYRFVGKE
jgi:two-component system KDP operon response regulator KdpE